MAYLLIFFKKCFEKQVFYIFMKYNSLIWSSMDHALENICLIVQDLKILFFPPTDFIVLGFTFNCDPFGVNIYKWFCKGELKDHFFFFLQMDIQ